MFIPESRVVMKNYSNECVHSISGFFLKSRLSEIRVNQGVGVHKMKGQIIFCQILKIPAVVKK